MPKFKLDPNSSWQVLNPTKTNIAPIILIEGIRFLGAFDWTPQIFNVEEFVTDIHKYPIGTQIINVSSITTILVRANTKGDFQDYLVVGGSTNYNLDFTFDIAGGLEFKNNYTLWVVAQNMMKMMSSLSDLENGKFAVSLPKVMLTNSSNPSNPFIGIFSPLSAVMNAECGGIRISYDSEEFSIKLDLSFEGQAKCGVLITPKQE